MARRPKIGEPRQRRQPFLVDKLPQKMRDRIEAERAFGRTWREIEDDSPTWQEWDCVAADVLALFPGKRLPHSNLQRWYDVRVEQVRAEMERAAERAREMSAAIAKVADLDQLGAAAVQALHDQVFGVSIARTPEQFAKGVEGLGYLVAKLTDAKSKKVRADAEAKRITLLEEELQRKRKEVEKQTEAAAAKLGKGKAVTLDDINRIRERVFGLPPVAAGHPA